MSVDMYKPSTIVVVTPAAKIDIALKFTKIQPNKTVLVVRFKFTQTMHLSIQTIGFCCQYQVLYMCVLFLLPPDSLSMTLSSFTWFL